MIVVADCHRPGVPRPPESERASIAANQLPAHDDLPG